MLVKPRVQEFLETDKIRSLNQVLLAPSKELALWTVWLDRLLQLFPHSNLLPKGV
jgi:hypothetical protein